MLKKFDHIISALVGLFLSTVLVYAMFITFEMSMYDTLPEFIKAISIMITFVCSTVMTTAGVYVIIKFLRIISPKNK